jgi:hypothetical protein
VAELKKVSGPELEDIQVAVAGAVREFMTSRKSKLKERTVKALLHRPEVAESVRAVLKEGGEREAMSKTVQRLLLVK